MHGVTHLYLIIARQFNFHLLFLALTEVITGQSEVSAFKWSGETSNNGSHSIITYIYRRINVPRLATQNRKPLLLRRKKQEKASSGISYLSLTSRTPPTLPVVKQVLSFRYPRSRTFAPKNKNLTLN